MKIGYVRVSTIEQNEESQVRALNGAGVKKLFIDKCSGKDTNRPQLEKMLEFVGQFQEIQSQVPEENKQHLEIYIRDFSRLARNTADLLRMVNDFKSMGVTLISVKDSFDMSTPQGEFMITMLGAVSQLERAIMKEKQKEGIAIAKEQGKYKGRKSFEIDEKFKECYSLWETRKLSVKDFMEQMGIKSRTTFYKVKAEYEREGK